MSFFHKPDPTPSPAPAPGFRPSGKGHRGDRSLGQRLDAEPVPHHRANGVRTHAKVDRLPNGKLFAVAGGFFDKDGYWCVRKADKRVDVTRGAPRKIMAMLTTPQRKELERERLRARRHGLR